VAPPGIVKVIGLVPVFVAIGAAKLPAAFDNCAVNTLPALKVPVVVKGTEIVCPAQYTKGVIGPVVIVVGGAQDAGAVKRLFTVKVHKGFAEKFAVTVTGKPFAVKPVNVTVCGLVVIGKL
jgi:hypothetical protein